MSHIDKHYADKLSTEEDKRIKAPAAERNKEPIYHVIKDYLDKPSVQVLEVASGPGQHVAYFAELLSHVTWQPTDIDNDYLRSISSYIAKHNLGNVHQPQYLDISKPLSSYDFLKPESYDLIMNANMIHISPWETSEGLFSFAGQLLKSNGVLFLYGPYKLNGVLTPESNVMFDKRLRSQDPSWGIRDTTDLEKLACKNGLKFEKMLVFIVFTSSKKTTLYFIMDADEVYRHDSDSDISGDDSNSISTDDDQLSMSTGSRSRSGPIVNRSPKQNGRGTTPAVRLYPVT